MLIRILTVIAYIAYCVPQRAKPWNYFQLNVLHFNDDKKIFSKLDNDLLIPPRWRLEQSLDIGQEPSRYPVFVKPEWGQNSAGVELAKDSASLASIRKRRPLSKHDYLIQDAAQGSKEFEIFAISELANADTPLVFSITETCNSSNEQYPVNGIYNTSTYYVDISAQLSPAQKAILWQQLKLIQTFRIARFGVRCDSLEDLLDGKFQVIEINLFIPMPLALIASNTTRRQAVKLSLQCAKSLVKATKDIPKQQEYKDVFFKKMRHSRSFKSVNS